MSANPTYKTWDEFWAKFLQITFHLHNPERWSTREPRARWCQTHLGVQTGERILNVGCGDGILDIWLSRMGMEMTAVDRNPSILAHAKSDDDTGRVNFITSDLRKLTLAPESFHGALFLECSGLVKQEEDLQLFKSTHSWLKPGGKFLIDCPLDSEISGSWTRTFPEGELTWNHSFDPGTRIFRIEPWLKDSTGHVIGLKDPIRDDRIGLTRYYYPKPELTSMLESVGFKVADAEPHYYGKNWFALVVTK